MFAHQHDTQSLLRKHIFCNVITLHSRSLDSHRGQAAYGFVERHTRMVHECLAHMNVSKVSWHIHAVWTTWLRMIGRQLHFNLNTWFPDLSIVQAIKFAKHLTVSSPTYSAGRYLSKVATVIELSSHSRPVFLSDTSPILQFNKLAVSLNTKKFWVSS